MLIIIEGNIGAGKSHLTKALVDRLGARAMYEPVETNPYLEDYYSDSKRWGLEMQYWLMARRFEMHEEAIKHIAYTGQAIVMDRSIYGDSVFAKKNWLDGNIDDRGYKSYMQHRKLYIDRLLTPNVTLFLDVKPEVCYQRIHELRQRECESGVPLEYLKGLDKCYSELLMELEDRGSHVIRIDWNSFKTIDEVLEQLEANKRFSLFWKGYSKEVAIKRSPITGVQEKPPAHLLS
ncbi:MAG: deoxynucleoside kinase [Oligoflexia bacterium]|nr:deoxynucleoside kinase [Oligoflexia bacterium]